MLALTGRAQETLLCLRVCVSGYIGDGRNWSVRKGRRECQRGGEGNREVLGVQSVNRKWGEISRGTAGREKKRWTHSSLSFGQGSQASDLILLMVLWLRWSCCRDSRPYSQPLLTSVRLL